MSRCLAVPLAGLLLSLTACQTAPAPTAESQARSAAPPDAAAADIAGRVMTEENVGLLFNLMRQSLNAAAEGKPAPQLSPEEKARLEASGKELQRQALEATMRLLDQAEREMRQAIRTETQR